MPSQFLVIRGAPGVGKSTVAALLKEHFPSGVCIEVDTLRMMVHANCWTDQQQHASAIELAAKMGLHYAARGHRPVIFVDTFGFGTLRSLTRQLDSAAIAVYSLTATNWTITQRIRRRKNHDYKDWLRSIFINRDILTTPTQSGMVIETSGMTPGKVANFILEREFALACAPSAPFTIPSLA